MKSYLGKCKIDTYIEIFEGCPQKKTELMINHPLGKTPFKEERARYDAFKHVSASSN